MFSTFASSFSHSLSCNFTLGAFPRPEPPGTLPCCAMPPGLGQQKESLAATEGEL